MSPANASGFRPAKGSGLESTAMAKPSVRPAGSFLRQGERASMKKPRTGAGLYSGEAELATIRLANQAIIRD